MVLVRFVLLEVNELSDSCLKYSLVVAFFFFFTTITTIIITTITTKAAAPANAAIPAVLGIPKTICLLDEIKSYHCFYCRCPQSPYCLIDSCFQYLGLPVDSGKLLISQKSLHWKLIVHLSMGHSSLVHLSSSIRQNTTYHDILPLLLLAIHFQLDTLKVQEMDKDFESLSTTQK